MTQCDFRPRYTRILADRGRNFQILAEAKDSNRYGSYYHGVSSILYGATSRYLLYYEWARFVLHLDYIYVQQSLLVQH